MDPKAPLFSTLSYRYALAAGFSHSAELFAIIVWSSMFYFAVFFGDICQLVDQCCLSQLIQIQNVEWPEDWSLLQPLRVFWGDIYLVFRVLFIATVTPVSAMLVGNAKGVQAVLSGAVATTFLLNIDDTIFKSMQDSMMVSKTRLFQLFLEPTFKKLREHDKTEVSTPVLRGLGEHFGRWRTSIAIIMALCLWVTSITIAIRVAIGYSTPMKYFDVYNGFAAIGGISLMIYCFVAVAMFQCEPATSRSLRPMVNILQLGCAILWVFVAFYKIIAWGFLAWGIDLPPERQCDCNAQKCESDIEVMARVLARQFQLIPYEDLKNEREWNSDELLFLGYVQNRMVIPMYICFAVHVLLTWKEMIPPIRKFLSTSWDPAIRLATAKADSVCQEDTGKNTPRPALNI